MFFFIILSLILRSLSGVNTMLDQDLESLFSDKHCIEASMVSMSLDKNEMIIVDSTNAKWDSSDAVNVHKNIVSKINELAQYNDIEVAYKLIGEDGPPHAKIYTVNLVIGDETYEGSGPSLKKAKQAAAILALENTVYEEPPQKLETEEEQPQTPTVVLNNIAMKLGLGVSYYLLNGKEEQSISSYGVSDEAYGKSKSYYSKINDTSSFLRVPVEEPQLSGPFAVKVAVADLSFKGIGHTIQAARHDAASKAIQHMERQVFFKDNVCAKEESVEECKIKRENLKSPISRVHEAAQKQNLPIEFNVISETGKSHKKVFVTRCKLGSFETEGEATSKKESKNIAAEKMLKYLPYLPEKYDESAIVGGLTNKKNKKKKKKKMIRANNDFINTVSQIASSLWDSSDNVVSTNGDNSLQNKKRTEFKKSAPSSKDKLLEIGGKLNIPLDFTDLSKNADEFYSLLSLGVQPPHVCLGKAATREKSHEKAALYGIKFLYKSGIFEKSGFTEYQQSEFEEYELDKETVYGSLDDVEESKS